MSLLGNSIYVVLYLMPYAESDKYHWGIVVKSWDCPSGMLFHVYNQLDKWHFEAKSSNFETEGASALGLKIGTVSGDTSWMEVRDIVTRVMLNWPLGFSCRTWVKDAVIELHKEGILSCVNAEALEQEAKHFAAMYRRGRENGDGPWGHHISTISI